MERSSRRSNGLVMAEEIKNPNNCEACDHWKMQRAIEAADPTETKLHCYMFKTPFEDVCMQHSARKLSFFGGSPTGRIKELYVPEMHSMPANFPIQTFITDLFAELKRNAPTGAQFD